MGDQEAAGGADGVSGPLQPPKVFRLGRRAEPHFHRQSSPPRSLEHQVQLLLILGAERIGIHGDPQSLQVAQDLPDDAPFPAGLCPGLGQQRLEVRHMDIKKGMEETTVAPIDLRTLNHQGQTSGRGLGHLGHERGGDRSEEEGAPRPLAPGVNRIQG